MCTILVISIAICLWPNTYLIMLGHVGNDYTIRMLAPDVVRKRARQAVLAFQKWSSDSLRFRQLTVTLAIARLLQGTIHDRTKGATVLSHTLESLALSLSSTQQVVSILSHVTNPRQCVISTTFDDFQIPNLKCTHIQNSGAMETWIRKPEVQKQ